MNPAGTVEPPTSAAAVSVESKQRQASGTQNGTKSSPEGKIGVAQKNVVALLIACLP